MTLDNDTIIYLNLTYEVKKSEDFNNLNNNLNLPWDFENTLPLIIPNQKLT